MDDGHEFQYASDDEEDVDEEAVIKNKRGKGKTWRPVIIFPNMEAARESLAADNTRLKGRINRGVTNAYYFDCKFKSCGCKVQWRLVTSQTSFEVTEEVYDVDHTSHDEFKRNGGRGLSDDQVEMVDLAVESGYKKPLQIVKFFESTAQALLRNG
jgi:hypothetical protein